ncbi:MAG: ATP-binding cassette domain-containing protein, partial [Lachnospiraceae bacterium]|nr:ATP-binding cassette domain-containing protein [Lachnospiraceae bacterium]
KGNLRNTVGIGGGMSVGMIQAFVQYLYQFSEPVSEAMQIVPTTQAMGASATRVFEFIDEKEEVEDVENAKFPAVLKGAVEFDHVKFGYLPHRTLIHDLDIKINPGEKVAIVGPTGAGKTTLVNLIMRFYDVKGGAIRIDGVDIRDMKRSDLRDIFGMVLQETWLYSGTIMENIRYGKLDATDEEVINAAKAARADGFIRTLPGGYNFELHEGAANIAQGQRQLLTIARAMLSNPPILILDEATSSVDTRTEVLIQEAMTNIMKGKTSFVIAHRLSTIKDSNKILYMQDGDILEVGTHDELMAKNGLYAKLYNSQFEK